MYYICEYCGNTDKYEYNNKCYSCGYNKIHVMKKTFITEECPVCVENKGLDNLYLFTCGHNTCKQCSCNLNKCPLCNTNKMKIYDGNNVIDLPIDEINMMPDVVISKDKYKYVIMFVQWMHCCREYKKLNNFNTYCVPFKNCSVVKFIRKYYDKYLMANKNKDNIVFFWTDCNSFYNVYIDMYKNLYPNGLLCDLNDDNEYDKKFCLDGNHQLFVNNVIHRRSLAVCFNVGDTFKVVKQRCMVLGKIMNHWDERIHGLYIGKILYDDFVFGKQHVLATINILLGIRGD